MLLSLYYLEILFIMLISILQKYCNIQYAKLRILQIKLHKIHWYFICREYYKVSPYIKVISASTKLPEESAGLRGVNVLPIFLCFLHFGSRNAQGHLLLVQNLFISNQILNQHLIISLINLINIRFYRLLAIWAKTVTKLYPRTDSQLKFQ